MFGRRVPLSSTVQRRYILIKPTCPNCIGVGLCASVPLTVIEWLGVIALRSDGSAFTGVKGRELSAYLTRQKVVFNTSSVRRRVPRIVYSTLLKLRTNLSLTPPWCGALGGLNLRLMPLCASSVAMLSVFHFSIQSRSSFSAPMKLVPLSDQFIAGEPRRETKRSTPITHELVSMDGTTSTSTAQVVRRRMG